MVSSSSPLFNSASPAQDSSLTVFAAASVLADYEESSAFAFILFLVALCLEHITSHFILSLHCIVFCLGVLFIDNCLVDCLSSVHKTIIIPNVLVSILHSNWLSCKALGNTMHFLATTTPSSTTPIAGQQPHSPATTTPPDFPYMYITPQETQHHPHGIHAPSSGLHAPSITTHAPHAPPHVLPSPPLPHQSSTLTAPTQNIAPPTTAVLPPPSHLNQSSMAEITQMLALQMQNQQQITLQILSNLFNTPPITPPNHIAVPIIVTPSSAFSTDFMQEKCCTGNVENPGWLHNTSTLQQHSNTLQSHIELIPTNTEPSITFSTPEGRTFGQSPVQPCLLDSELVRLLQQQKCDAAQTSSTTAHEHRDTRAKLVTKKKPQPSTKTTGSHHLKSLDDMQNNIQVAEQTNVISKNQLAQTDIPSTSSHNALPFITTPINDTTTNLMNSNTSFAQLNQEDAGDEENDPPIQSFEHSADENAACNDTPMCIQLLKDKDSSVLNQDIPEQLKNTGYLSSLYTDSSPSINKALQSPSNSDYHPHIQTPISSSPPLSEFTPSVPLLTNTTSKAKNKKLRIINDQKAAMLKAGIS
ncbi:hypothetical protein LguiA_011261 [Lonicera macranthoides]